MKDTGFWVDTAKQGRIAEPFELDPDTKAPARLPDVRKQPRFLSGGGMVSTATDYMRFAQMLLNGGELDGVRILSRKTVELMTSDQLGSTITRGPLVFPWTRLRVRAWRSGSHWRCAGLRRSLIRRAPAPATRD